MAQLVKLGKFLAEIDGTHLVFFDAAGNPLGQAQDLDVSTAVALPDGTKLAPEQLADLIAGNAEAFADFKTAAGGDTPGDQPSQADSGSNRFAVFEDQTGLGGLTSVGGLGATDEQPEPALAARGHVDDLTSSLNTEPPVSLTNDQPQDPAPQPPTDEEPAPEQPQDPAPQPPTDEEPGPEQPQDPAPQPPTDEEPGPEQPQDPAPQPPTYVAPEASATKGAVEYHNDVENGKQNPLGDIKVGDYLTRGGDEGKSIDPTMVNGVDNQNLTLAQTAEVKIGFVSEAAGYKSMVGVYQFDDSGKIIPGTVQLVWLDASQIHQGTVGGALSKDFLGNSQPLEISLGNVAADSKLGFFIIADGAANNDNQKLLTSLAGVSKQDNYTDDLTTINKHISFQTDQDGNGHVLIDGKPLAGNVYFTHDKSLNTDANSNDIEHSLSGVSSQNDGKLYVGFEDQARGGDHDYQDLVISVDMGSYNINKLTQTVTQPTVDLSDADSSHLSSAAITTYGFHAEDHLNVPHSDLFDVQLTHDGNDLTVTITAKAGTETIGSFEDFINHIYFSTTSTDLDYREISYEVTDADGQHSNVSTVPIEFSLSDGGAGASTPAQPGGSDDVLHLNIQEIGQYHDMGAGHDTVQLGHGNMSFGHNDAQMLDNIEVIDAKGAGHNDISLSAIDVLDMTDGDHHLTVLGKTGDSLTLTGEGGHNWTVTDQGADFTTYSYNDGVHQAIVEVSNQMQQTVV
ncbi:MAG: DUF4114 domain-containing protein [Proteobacteria bacterium]|nr:DUF4114 domain-containing protein [Pseudomonadota bacterium]